MNLWKFCETILFHEIEWRNGWHPSHLFKTVEKQVPHMEGERNKPFLGALEYPTHSMAVCTMDLSAVPPVQRSLL